ncbi:transaldolase [Blastococcus sp. CCUG 61487]|uniref:transaldolase n=1 Tax=Blastococcus sp. CCUG 61487 TaxID=1840703 RepID=UPI0010C01E18|nr:transaldolase [Blastococcus sp. CCUG 61487]TKJ16855.1 transaldolase [Blastococcus sp. CCUG 61487]
MSTPLHQLTDHGQSAWIDYLSRRFIHDGDLTSLVEQGVRGVTSNPTIFQAAIAEGSAYDDQFREVLATESDAKAVFLALACADIQATCDALAEVHAQGDETRDGWVSLEVDPHLAHDTAATVAEAARLHALIDRPNLFIKIPATEEGIPAIEETIAAGIPVNVTLLFSLDRHRAAAQAYIRGLRRLQSSGGDLRTVASVASFFVSRVDTEADKWLDAVDDHDTLRGTLGIANAKLAYQTYLQLFTGAVWNDLADAGASPQRCLWASTGVKNPDYRDVVYIEQLIGPDTVTTMPRDTLEAFRDHGTVADTLTDGLDDARATMQRFADAGLDYADLTALLEREGVEKFVASFDQLFATITARRDELIPE